MLNKTGYMLTDTHSHIYLNHFSDDRDDVVLRAIDAGVEKILLPNIDSTSIDSMLDLTGSHPHICYPLMGLHPTSVKENFEDELTVIAQWLEKREFVGIGETGVDLYWDETFLDEQVAAFRQHLIWAKRYQLPVVIHVRKSFDVVHKIVREEHDEHLSGIFHCFGGSLQEAQKIIDLGFKIGIGGVVTFKNSGLDEVVRRIDLSHMVLETDAPYLAPVPFRGQRNESAYLVQIAEKVATLHSVTTDEVAAITSENARHIFPFENF